MAFVSELILGQTFDYTKKKKRIKAFLLRTYIN